MAVHPGVCCGLRRLREGLTAEAAEALDRVLSSDLSASNVVQALRPIGYRAHFNQVMKHRNRNCCCWLHGEVSA